MIHKIIAIYSRGKQLKKIVPLIDVFKLIIFSYLSREDRMITINPFASNHTLKIRNNIIDERTIIGTFKNQYHLPPSEAKFQNHPIIIDLGANIGSTCCHMKKLYPKAIIIGYELDKENAELAKENTKSLENVTIVNHGVWYENSISTYSSEKKTNAYRVEDLESNNPAVTQVKLISIEDILSEYDKIDFLKMDIEGAEIDILQKTDLNWIKKINNINIEFHLEDPKDIEVYKDLLIKHGFIISENNKHWCSIIAHRNQL